MALVWAALLGTFSGAILPFWRSEAAIAQADAARAANPPKFEVAEAAYREAYASDKCSARPWLGLAFEKYQEWESRGAKPEDMRWKTIPASMVEAVPPRASQLLDVAPRTSQGDPAVAQPAWRQAQAQAISRPTARTSSRPPGVPPDSTPAMRPLHRRARSGQRRDRDAR